MSPKGHIKKRATCRVYGYVGGDRSSPDVIPVNLYLPGKGKSKKEERYEFFEPSEPLARGKSVYRQLKEQGILGDDMPFELVFYNDGEVKVMPVKDSRKLKIKLPALDDFDSPLARLEEIQAKKRKEILERMV